MFWLLSPTVRNRLQLNIRLPPLLSFILLISTLTKAAHLVTARSAPQIPFDLLLCAIQNVCIMYSVVYANKESDATVWTAMLSI